MESLCHEGDVMSERTQEFQFEPVRCQKLDGLKKPFPTASSSHEELLSWMDAHNEAEEVVDQGFQNSLDFSQTTTNNDLELQSETDSFEEDLARIDDIDAFLKPQETSPVKQCNSNGFATASGRQISVSESALEAARSKFDSDSLLQTDTCGFATASGSKISISSQSLEKAQSLWRHMGDQEPLIGLSAASCKKIPISESALSKGNQIYNEVLEERPLLLKQKPIPISQKALAQGRRLMGPILADTEPGKQESSTLDGDTKSSLLKPRQLTRKSGLFKKTIIPISSEAMNKATRMWSEVSQETCDGQNDDPSSKRIRLEEPSVSSGPPSITSKTPTTGPRPRSLGLSRRSLGTSVPLASDIKVPFKSPTVITRPNSSELQSEEKEELGNEIAN